VIWHSEGVILPPKHERKTIMKKKRQHATRKDTLDYRKKQRASESDDMGDLWDADVCIARSVAGMLGRFIPYCDMVGATPSDFCKDGKADHQAWHDCMEEMLFAFRYCADERNIGDTDRKTQVRVRHGLSLFAKHLQSLWV